MSGLRTRDRLLLAVMLPIWLACFALFVAERWSGKPTRPTLLVTSAGESGYPEVVRYRPGLELPADALRAGDRVIVVGDRANLSRLAELAQGA